jgi:hypothetical protein
MTKDQLLCKGIRADRIEIEAQISDLRSDLNSLQQLCPHVNATKTYKSSSGNYDPSMDRQWFEYECPDCGKRWTEEK